MLALAANGAESSKGQKQTPQSVIEIVRVVPLADVLGNKHRLLSAPKA